MSVFVVVLTVWLHVQTRSVLGERVLWQSFQVPLGLQLPRREALDGRRRAVKRPMALKLLLLVVSTERRNRSIARLLLVLAGLDAVVCGTRVRTYYPYRAGVVLHGRDDRRAFVVATQSALHGLTNAAVHATLRVAAMALAVAVRERLLHAVDRQALAVATVAHAETVVLHDLVAVVDAAALAATMRDARATALRALDAALEVTLLATTVDPAKAAGLRALGARLALAALAAAVRNAEAPTHDARRAAVDRALLAAAVRDAEATGFCRLDALGEPAAARPRASHC